MKGIWTYHHLLPPVANANRISLGEGHTPLLASRRIGPALGLRQLYFKLEITNPTGSYKDRFAASAVSQLLETRAAASLATSSGNTGAALAAYCAAAGIPAFTVTVDGAPAGKVQQMQAYGAHVMTVEHFGKVATISTAVMQALAGIAQECGAPVQISAYAYQPTGMAGVETIAFELAEALPDGRMQLFSPAGGGGLTLAVAKGFTKWQGLHPDFRNPKVHCVQPTGNNTIAGPLREGASGAREIPAVTTAVSGLQVPNVLDGDAVVAHCRESGGTGFLVADSQVYQCQQRMAAEEGIFCEPAGAVALAGVLQAIKENSIDPGEPVVCLVTGHGFKDPAGAIRLAEFTPDRRLNDPEDIGRLVRTILKKRNL